MTEAGASDANPEMCHRNSQVFTKNSSRTHPERRKREAAKDGTAGDVQAALDRVIGETSEFPQWSQPFYVARALKSLEFLTTVEPERLKQWVRYWHDSSDSPREWDLNWEDFLAAWERVRFLVGDGMQEFLRRADSRPVVPELLEYGEQVQRLGMLCRELQAWYGRTVPFYFGGRLAAELILGRPNGPGDQETAARWFRILLRCKLLEVAKPADVGKRKATYYFWKGSLPGNPE